MNNSKIDNNIESEINEMLSKRESGKDIIKNNIPNSPKSNNNNYGLLIGGIIFLIIFILIISSLIRFIMQHQELGVTIRDNQATTITSNAIENHHYRM